MQRFNRIQLRYFTFFLFCLITAEFAGQIVVDEAPRGLYYRRTQRIRKFKDMKDFRDVFHNDKFLLGRNRIMGNVSYNVQRVIVDNGVERNTEWRSALSFYTRYRFFEEFSVNTTFYVDFNKQAAARWVADFNYSIGRYNWRPRRFNFGYENYVNNKYTDDVQTLAEKFMEGYYFLSYNYAFTDGFQKKIKIDSTTSLRFSPFVRWAFRYRDEFLVPHYEGKPTAGISGRYTLFWNIYIEGAVYYYFTPMFRQLPWDPDYTYGFGYFDYRSFRFSLTYGNWAVNRFPWKKQTYPDYGFFDGNFKFTVNWIW